VLARPQHKWRRTHGTPGCQVLHALEGHVLELVRHHVHYCHPRVNMNSPRSPSGLEALYAPDEAKLSRAAWSR
jgi:hypothetical protein